MNRWSRDSRRWIIREKQPNKPTGVEDRSYISYNRRRSLYRTRHRLQWLGGERISFLVSLVRGSATIVLLEETFKDPKVTISNVSRQRRC